MNLLSCDVKCVQDGSVRALGQKTGTPERGWGQCTSTLKEEKEVENTKPCTLRETDDVGRVDYPKSGPQ